MRIIVFGASGEVGKNVVRLACERGHKVTAFVRAETPFSADTSVNIVQGNVLDQEALTAAIAGHDVVISCLGLKRANAKNPFSKLVSPEDFASSSAHVIVNAMKSAGVSRIVAVSAAGVAESAARMSPILRFMFSISKIGIAYRDLAIMESVYRDSGLDWTCVRPTTLTDGPATTKTHEVDGYGAMASISRANVAAWVLDAVASAGPTMNRTPMISE